MMPSRTVAEGPVCARPDTDPETWFDIGRRAEAVLGCKSCPLDLRAACLVASYQQPVYEASFGIWGGMTPAQRAKVKVRYGIVTHSHARELLGAIA